jgi:lysophospholipase L1-like esterase
MRARLLAIVAAFAAVTSCFSWVVTAERASPIEIGFWKPTIWSTTDAGDTKRGIVILHIGDSHTSADFFTGDLRRFLQAHYGQGGIGYIAAGRPSGFRNSTVNVKASSGWTYKSLDHRDVRPEEFWLSGHNAVATAANETIKYTSEQPLLFTSIEIEAIRQPGAGSIEVKLDNLTDVHYDLNGKNLERVLIREPAPNGSALLNELLIRTTRTGRVSIAGVWIHNDVGALTYNSIGYPGATVAVLNKLDDGRFATDLQRLNPQIVVLSFGTNEAADQTLDPVKYSQSYELVVSKIQWALPTAAILLILPPDFNQLPRHCHKETAVEASCEWTSSGVPPGSDKLECVWRTPPKLAQVREEQRNIAARHGFNLWDWNSIMPNQCGAHKWFTMKPPLMSPDHVHLTPAGYGHSAEEFLPVLSPIIERFWTEINAISHD